MLIYIAYFIFFMVLAVEHELKPFKNNLLLLITVLLLGLLAGLRGPEVSKDYEAYQSSFDYMYEMIGKNDGIFLPIFEPGFSLIVVIFRSLFEYNYGLAIMLFFGLTSVLLKSIAIKRISINPYLVILFYFSQYFLLHEMTQIRIGFASAIFFIALIYYLKNNRKVYVLIILVATFFHYTAIMYLVLLLFNPKYFNKYIYSIILAFSLLLGYLKIPILDFLGNFDPASISGRLRAYTDLVESGNAESINVFNTLNLINIACCLYLIIFIPKMKLIADKPLLLFLKCNILSIFLLSLLSGVPSMAFRFSELFGTVSIFLYASLVKYLPFIKFNILITIIIASVIFYISAFHSDLLRPYYIINIK